MPPPPILPIVDSWLDDPRLKDWLVKDKQNIRARLVSSGKLALTDHGKGKKHKCFVKSTERF